MKIKLTFFSLPNEFESGSDIIDEDGNFIKKAKIILKIPR